MRRPSRRAVLGGGIGGALALGAGAFWATRSPEISYARMSLGPAAGARVLAAYPGVVVGAPVLDYRRMSAVSAGVHRLKASDDTDGDFRNFTAIRR